MALRPVSHGAPGIGENTQLRLIHMPLSSHDPLGFAFRLDTDALCEAGSRVLVSTPKRSYPSFPRDPETCQAASKDFLPKAEILKATPEPTFEMIEPD